jgi:hypothetical protein
MINKLHAAKSTAREGKRRERKAKMEKRGRTYIVICQQVEGAVQLVILEVEGPGGVEVSSSGEGLVQSRFLSLLLLQA